MYESIYWVWFLARLGPVNSCCWWLCLEVRKRQKTVRTRTHPRVCTNTVHRRETVEKQGFRSCPEKKRENRTKPRFCTVCSYGAPWRKKGVVRFSLRRVEPHRRKNRSGGTAPNHTVRYITAPNHTVGFTTSEDRTDPHRRIYHSTEPHRRISYFQIRTEPHRRISYFFKPHRTEP